MLQGQGRIVAMPQQIINNKQHSDYWYVMCHPSPQQIETLLQKDCAGLFRKPEDVVLPPYRYYVPFQNIPCRASQPLADTETSDKHYRPQQDVSALRYDLHDFVFIQASEERIAAIVHSDWNSKARLHLYHYRDTNHQVVTIPDAEMRLLMTTIQDRHLQFYIDQPLCDFSIGDKVMLTIEPWSGKHGVITKIAIKHGQLCMTISLNILGRTKSINFLDVHVGDVIFEDAERGRLLSNNPIDNYEEEILDLLNHRFGRHYTDEIAKNDKQRLKRLSTYDHIYVDDTNERIRFSALRLISAYLLQSERRRNHYEQEVVALLGNKQEAETDRDAYLMIALFVVTRQARWRQAVKNYRNTHPECLPVFKRYHAILKDVRAKK